MSYYTCKQSKSVLAFIVFERLFIFLINSQCKFKCQSIFYQLRYNKAQENYVYFAFLSLIINSSNMYCLSYTDNQNKLLGQIHQLQVATLFPPIFFVEVANIFQSIVFLIQSRTAFVLQQYTSSFSFIRKIFVISLLMYFHINSLLNFFKSFAIAESLFT